MLLLTDAAALAAALIAAAPAAGRPGGPGWPAAGYLAGGYAALVLAALSWSGLQRLRICLRVSDQFGRLLAALAAPALLLLPWVPAVTALRLVAWSAGLVVGLRIAVMTVLRTARRRGHLTEPTLLVGAGATGEQLARLLREHPELGLRPSGFVDDSPRAGTASLPVLGRPADLAAAVRRHGIRRVIVCPPDDRHDEFAAILRDCPGLRADICMVLALPGLGAAVPAACLDELWGVRLVPLVPARRRQAMLLKRGFDLVAAVLLLCLAAPLLGLLALAIRRPGHPALFRQARVVGRGRHAQIIKLRTMSSHPDSDTCWVVPTERLTTIGRWLRASHLDELPQLINVIRGDMSLVGPRPERPYFADRFGREIPRYNDRHRMRAGLTGLAQVHGLHGDTSIHERVRFDNLYIDNWSLWLDVVILARTLATIARAARRIGAGKDAW